MAPFGDYPYDDLGVFELDTFSWDKDLLAVSLTSKYTALPREYQHATGQDFWKDLRNTVLACCPGSSKAPCLADLDCDLYFNLGTELSAAMFERCALKVKEAVEQRAVQVWLRPGVPTLFSMVTKKLMTRGSLVASLMEFQHKYGYHASKQITAQYSPCLKLEA